MNASYQASLVNRHIRRFTGTIFQRTYILHFVGIYDIFSNAACHLSLYQIIIEHYQKDREFYVLDEGEEAA